ncbi:hypothetical protein NPIL_13821 [Nephila pilipes]|uniref:Inorganic phosphate cotransporter n=1 Tax=Nephila pilipes TaxID=299642 RepID=A0A8X6IWM1_NEPPI|nr:hypothetical protein NPIL_244641 [Nephila pilipes]GFS63949.1 hypothetical protein NPIL_13821 [Nephila pilipes]
MSGTHMSYFLLESDAGKKKYIPKRWILMALGFFGFFNVYAMRVNLSVAMVAMVKQPVEHEISDSSSVACRELIKPTRKNDRLTLMSERTGEFDWDISTQATILGSFFYGYVITQIPGGNISERYGAKWLFGIGTILGVTNGIGNLAGFLAPAYVGIITGKGQTVNNWRIVFLTASALLTVSGLVFNFFCTAELQPWGISETAVERTKDDDSESVPMIDDTS